MTATVEKTSQEAIFAVSGMDCASCVAHVEKAARKVGGVEACSVNLARGRAVVRFDPAQTDIEKVAAAITDSGYPAHAEVETGANAEEHRVAQQAEHARSWFRRAIVGVTLWLPVEALHWILTATSHHGEQHGWM